MTSLLSLAWTRLRGRARGSKTARCIGAGLIIGLLAPQASFAEAKLKLITLTADWCAKCHLLEPALSRALQAVPSGTVDYIEIDLTHMRDGPEARQGVSAASAAHLAIHKAGWIWEAYGERTGFAFLIDARSGEPFACLTSAIPAETMASQLKLASRMVEDTESIPYSKSGPDCPALIG